MANDIIPDGPIYNADGSLVPDAQAMGAPPKKQNKGFVGDIGTSLKIGAEQVPGQLAGVADILPALTTGTRPVTAIADYIRDKTGFAPGTWANDAQAEYSPQYNQAQQEIGAAWDDPNKNALDVAKEYATHPGYIANQVANSLPAMAAGGVASRSLMLAGRVALPAAEGIAEGAATQYAPGYLEKAVGDKWAAPLAGGIGEGAQQAGQQMQQYQGDDQRSNAVAALASGAVDALISAGAGHFANKLGFETAETAMAHGFDQQAKQELVGLAKYGTPGKILGGALSEGILQELPQSAQEQLWQNWADNKPLWDGVPRQAVEGAMAGFVMGAGANVLHRPEAGNTPSPTAADTTPGTPPPGPTLTLPSYAQPTMYAFSDGSTGTQEQIDQHIAALPPEQRAHALATMMYGAKVVEPSAPDSNNAAPAVSYPDAHPLTIQGAVNAGNLSGAISTNPEEQANATQATQAVTAEAQQQEALSAGQTSAVDQGAHLAATSPLNDQAEPSPEQKAAGNYKVGRAAINGLEIAIENPQGSVRSSHPDATPQWHNTMQDHYGYFTGVPARAPDKDHVDTFVKPGTPDTFNGDAFIIDQKHPDTGKFDEPKVMLGYSSAQQAQDAYHANYQKGWQGMMGVTPVPMDTLKTMLQDKTAFMQPQATTTATATPATTPAVPPAQQVAPADLPTKPQETYKDMLTTLKGNGIGEYGGYKYRMEGSTNPHSPYQVQVKGPSWNPINTVIETPRTVDTESRTQLAERAAANIADLHMSAVQDHVSTGKMSAADATAIYPALKNDFAERESRVKAQPQAPGATFDNPLHQRVSDIYRQMLAEGQPKDNKIPAGLWREQTQEQIDNPTRYSQVAEDDNPLGLRIGDRVAGNKADGTPLDMGIVTSIVGNAPRAYKGGFMVHTTRGGWSGIDGLQKVAGPEQTTPEKPALNTADDFPAKWDAMDYGARQTIAQASNISKMRKVVHRISGSKWAELGPGEQQTMRKAAAAADTSAPTKIPESFTTDNAELHRQGREYFSSAESVIKHAEENSASNFIFETSELPDVMREIEAHGFSNVAPKLWENDKGFTVTVGNQSSYDKTRTEVSLRPADKQQFAGQSLAQLEAKLATHNQQQVKSHEKREHLVEKVALLRRIAELKAQQAAPEKPPVKKPEKQPDQTAQKQAQAAQAAQHRAEKETFTALAGMQELANTVANTPHNFRAEAEAQVVKQVGAAIKAAFAAKDMEHVKALSALLADGKPTLPEAFYDGLLKEVQQGIKQQQQSELVAAAKSAMVLASATTDDKAAFEQGWNHALAGKTKSTLPNGDALAKGYAAASAWLKTDEGKAAYSGKRGKKLENTGADLRRWYEQQKAKITEGDTDTILANLDNATTRADLFRDVLPADATPGATRWLEGVRNKILPFKRWLTEKAALRNFDTYISSRTSDSEKMRQYLDGKLDLLAKRDTAKQSREQRITTLKDAADEYVTQVALLTDKLRGAHNIEELAKALDGAVFKPGTDGEKITRFARSDHYSAEGRQITALMIHDWRLLGNYGWDAKGYYLQNLLKNEQVTLEATRKAALTPPRLDRVDRDGADLRKGKNITPEQFKRKLGFADVGFGKWVGAKQDQDHLNYAYDAFLDLAQMVGLPPDAIGLGQRLHFTIGALGHGKFAAHYSQAQPHPDGGTVPVINVTNTRGDGTVAHEWSHALDLTPQVQAGSLNAALLLNKAIEEIKNELRYGYNFDRLRASVVSMLKGNSYWTRDKNARKTEDGRILNAERSIEHYALAAKNLSNYYKEALKLDGSNKKDPYWSNHKEIFARAFEAWIGDAMETSNTYLVNPAWSGDGVVTGATHRGTPYPVGDERERFNLWFSALAKSLRYDAEKKLVTLDPEAWQQNKPKTRAEWKQALDDLRAELPSMAKGLEREAEAAARQQADKKAHGASMQVGDRVKAREGYEPQFSEKFGDGGAVISEISEGTNGRLLYFDGSQSGIYAHNAEVVQRRADIEAQTKAAAAEAAPSTVEPVGELSETELSALFDQAVAEMQETTQEQPDAAEPGAATQTVSDGWSREDVQYIRDKIKDDGQMILFSGEKWAQEHDLPTIHSFTDKATVRHLGFGVFEASNNSYTVNWAAGGAMQQTPGGHAYTTVNVTDGAFAYPRDEVLKKLDAMLNRDKVNKAPLADQQTDQTAAKLATKTNAELIAKAAKLGLTGIDEALIGLSKLFGSGPGKLHSFPGHLDKKTYDEAKPHFIAALKAAQEAGQTLVQLFKNLVELFGPGVKPYAVYFAQEMKLTANLGSKPSASRTVAAYVKAKLDTGIKVSWQDLFNRADAAWGGTQAAGTYTVKDAYDAMELGVNLYLRDKGIKADTSTEGAVAEIKRLTALIDNLPTQTKRTAEHDEFQQFSTPPALAYAASWVANIEPSDTLLEPSAGTGDLAIYADNMGAKLILNELSSRRAELLKDLFPAARIFTENGEQLNNVLPDDAVPTVVVMNPPFSATAGRVQGSRDSANGAKHIEQALKRLPTNGRLVSISGALPKEWLAKIKQSYNVRAMIDISGKEYAKYGTTFDNQIVVIDNDGKTANDVMTGRVESVAELPKLLEGIRNDKPLVAQSATAQPGSSQNPETNRLDAGSENATGGSTTDAVGAGQRPAGAGTGVGDDRALHQPLSQLGGADNESGKNQSQTADAVPDGNGRGGQLRDQSEREGTGRSGLNAADGADTGGGRAAGETGGVTVNEAEKQKHAGELSNSIYEDYQPQRLAIPGATAHPGSLVQSAAMASVEPPAPTYTPNLPQAIIDGKTPWKKWVIDGKTGKWIQKQVKEAALSLAQIESIVYAGMAHQLFLPNGERRGFFIGDGTGVGKGREIAGIILDNLRQGQKKAIWLSANEGLLNDAKRDFSGIGGDPKLLFWHGKTPTANQIMAKDGILFSAYTTLKGGERKQANDHGQKEGQKRLDQILNWVGKDFDGVIVFDEAHKMGNLLPMKGKRGQTDPSQQAIAGANLQRMLPKARIVYVSATGATEVSNLAYASRLGLWGEGTPFTDARNFIEKIAQGGVAAMELISRDMKALGSYIARSLSYDGVTYSRLEHELTPLQNDIYNEMAKAWQGVLQNINAALKLTDGAKNGPAKGAAMAAFQGAQLRFFNQVITSMQTPTVIEDMKKNLAAGHAILIQLTNTNESTQEHEVKKAAKEGKPLEELDFTPRQTLMDYVRNSFPVQAYQAVMDGNGKVSYVAVTDSAGKPVFDKQAIAMREKLLETLQQLRVPENPLDAIIAAFGSENVGEVTGRGRRFVQQRDDDGNLKPVEEKRGKHANANDAADYQNDKKRILVFSEAGGTGFSFHADLAAKNQRVRDHYVLQPGWRADVTMQGFGRSHRTNQKQPPHYILPTTNLKGQKRFISSIARRLDQLGALTKGERKTASQGLFSASDNLESKYAADALDALFQDMYRGATPLDFHEVTKAMGLNLIDPKTGGLSVTKLPEIPKFLNRLLALQSHEQDAVFTEFEKRLDEIVNYAKQNGVYDNGMQTLKADSIHKVRDEVAYTDPRTGAQTRYVEVDVNNPIKYQPWEKAQAWAADHGGKFAGWFKNTKGETFGVVDMGERVHADGTSVYRGAINGIRAGHIRYVDNLKEIKQGWKWTKAGKTSITTELSESEAHKAWEAEVAAAPKHETTREHMIVGVILPVWDRVMGHPRIVRLQTDDGERMIGRVMGPKDAKATLKNLGLGSVVAKMSPDKMLADIHAGSKALLANGWEIAQTRVSGDNRIEITKPSGYFSGGELSILTQQGAFTERIQWKDRVFIPTGENEAAVFERIIQSKPVVDMFGANKDGEADAGLFSRAPSEAEVAATRKGKLDMVQQAIQPLREQWRGVRDIQVVQSATDLPVNILFHVMRAGGAEGMQGWYDTGTKAVYLVADNLRTPEEAKWVAIHEVVGHRGVRMLGKPVAAVLDQAGRNVFIGKLAHAIAQDRNEAYEPQMHSDEALAELAAATLMNNPDALWKRYGVSVPSAMRNGIEGIIGRVIEAVRNAVAKLLGRATDQVSDGDIRKLLLRMKGAAEGFDTSQSHDEAMQEASQYPTEPRQGREPSEYEQALKEAGILKSTPAQARLYSQLHRALNDAPAKIFGSGKAVAMWLQANQAKLGVKSDELYWTGINDWLHTQGKVSKDDVLAYLDHNGVQVQEVMLGAPENNAILHDAFSQYNGEYKYEVNPHDRSEILFTDSEGDSLDFDELPQDLQAAAEKFSAATGGTVGDTIYPKQVMPGGKNYRELLLTLPATPSKFDPSKVKLKRNRMSTTQGSTEIWYDGKYVTRYGDDPELRDGEYKQLPDAYWMDAAKILYEKGNPNSGVEKISQSKDFESSHFEQKNLLAHVRFNERTDADGKRVLFVEELQSDWGQQGRDQGFGKTVWRIKGDVMAFSTRKEADAYAQQVADVSGRDKREVYEAPMVGSVPAAPFVTDTKAWTALALKKIIAYAAQNDFDRVAWTTGEQQAQRNDLSKQIAEINYNRNSDGTYQLKIRTHRSGETIPDSINSVPLKRIPENMLQKVVGKEVAQKIIDGEGEQRQIWDSDKRPLKTLSGLDLKVGGEGMKGYYNGIVPQVASDILKKFGGKVEQQNVIMRPKVEYTGGEAVVTYPDGRVERYDTTDVANAAANAYAADTRQIQQGFTLTPAMREQIIGEGMPLFAKAPKGAAADILARYGKLTPEQAKVIPQVVGQVKSIAERAKEFSRDWQKNLVQGIVDQYAPIKEYSMMAYMRARMSKGVASTLEAIFMYGKPRLDENGDITGDFSSQNGGNNGFASVLSKLDGEHDRFILWVAALRAEHLKSIGLENLWSHDAITTLKTLDQGKLQNGKDRAAAYDTALKELNAYNDAVLKIASQRGLINDATRLMYENMPYVPFYRLSEENVVPGFAQRSGLVNQSAWKRLKGGTDKLNEDLLANMLQNWSHLIEAAARNDAAKLAIEAAVKTGAAVEVPTGYPGKGTVSFRDNVTTKLEQQQDGIYRRVQDFIPEGQAYEENGVQKISDGTVQQELNVERTFVVNDPHMLDAITSISDNMRVAKPLRQFKHALTIGVTANPAFKLRNLIRDSVQSMALGDLSYNPLKNINEGRKLVHFNSETRAKMLFGGGIIRFGSMLDGNNADKARELVNNGVLKEHILDNDNKLQGLWQHYIKPAFDVYQEFGDRGEQVNRAALYQRLIDKGMTHGEANYWARDLMDFSMSGKWKAIRFLTQTVPFMNARLQGLYKLGKAYKADKARFGYVVGGVAMASLMLMFLASRDDDDWKEWQKREDWDRDNYWWFKVGGHAFRVPKPFEIGAIGTLAERSWEYASDDEMTNKRFRDRLGNLVSQQLSINPTPQLVKPLIDLWANRDSFSGRPIETFGMDKMLPQDRFGQHTSSVAKLLGHLGLPNPAQMMMGNYEALSPVQIDYLVRSYFSWLGTAATTALEYGIFKPFQDSGETPATTLRDVFFVGNFAESLPSNQSRYVTQMYDQAQQIEQAYNSYRNALKTGDKERALGIRQDNKAELQQFHRVEEIKRIETVINTKIKLVTNSREMSADEKRQRLDQLNAQRDTLAKSMHPL